jgi:hypothetical protein
MRAAQTILGWLYCLLVVALPYLHFLFDAHGTEASVSTACSGHAHEHEPPPDGGNPDSHHESCLLCKLLTAASDAPEPAPVLQSGHVMVSFRSLADEACARTLIRTHRARAPPFMTVQPAS